MGAPLGLIFCKRALVRGHLLEPRATAAQHGRSRMAASARAADDDATSIVAVMLERIDAPEGTVTVTQWLGTDGPYSVCLWISSHTAATTIRVSSSSRPSGSISASLLSIPRRRGTLRWHLDEVFVSINGRQLYVWRAVDSEGEVLDILVQPRRDRKAALKLMRKLLKKQGVTPDSIVTDKLGSYRSALRELGIIAQR